MSDFVASRTLEHHDSFSVGTLTYSKKGLWLAFFWLMWNDFSITLLEQVTGLTRILMRDRGAAYTLMAGGILGMWINPFFSTWSDRFRSRFGRRRPFLFIAAPLFTVWRCAVPYMPDLYSSMTKLSSNGAKRSRNVLDLSKRKFPLLWPDDFLRSIFRS